MGAKLKLANLNLTFYIHSITSIVRVHEIAAMSSFLSFRGGHKPIVLVQCFHERYFGLLRLISFVPAMVVQVTFGNELVKPVVRKLNVTYTLKSSAERIQQYFCDFDRDLVPSARPDIVIGVIFVARVVLCELLELGAGQISQVAGLVVLPETEIPR